MIAFPLLDIRPELAERWLTPCWNNLQKLDWPDGIGIRTYGMDVALRADDASLFPHILAALPHAVEPSDAQVFDTIFSFIKGGREPSSRTRRFHLVYQDHTQIARSRELPEALEAFSPWFRITVGARAPRHVFIHAGVVEYRGRAVLLPGRTMAGKSTLVRALVEAGARYMSDDFAILDADGDVLPYAKPLTLRDEHYRQHIVDVPPAGSADARAVPPAMLVFTEFREGEHFTPQPATLGDAVLGLLDNCLTTHSDPERVTAALAGLTRRTVALIGPRGEAAEAAQAILEMVEAEAMVSA